LLIDYLQDPGSAKSVQPFAEEYLVSTHLWMTLHYHREDRIPECLQSAQRAWDISKRKFLNLVQASPVKIKPARKSGSPKTLKTTIKSKPKAAVVKKTAAAKASTRPKQARTRASRVTVKDPVTPKLRKGALLPSC
jgi:hypothetical protein